MEGRLRGPTAGRATRRACAQGCGEAPHAGQDPGRTPRPGGAAGPGPGAGGAASAALGGLVSSLKSTQPSCNLVRTAAGPRRPAEPPLPSAPARPSVRHGKAAVGAFRSREEAAGETRGSGARDPHPAPPGRRRPRDGPDLQQQ